VENNIQHEYWMLQALALAEHAEHQGEVPIGALIVYEGKKIAEGWNQPILSHDPCAHAEIIALRQAARLLNNYRLLNTTMYVTLEPCIMCAGALVHARVKNLVFAARDPKAGAVQSIFQVLDDPRLNHRVNWEGGILGDVSGDLLRKFFLKRR